MRPVLPLRRFIFSPDVRSPSLSLQLYLMRVTDASLLRSLRRQQNHDVAGMLGVLCCTKMLGPAPPPGQTRRPRNN